MKGTRFHDLVGSLRAVLAGLPDRRKGKNLSYAMEEFGLSAFSVFFTQSPSFLAHQKTLQAARGKNNAQSFFQIHEIPSDNQTHLPPNFRIILDGTSSSRVFYCCSVLSLICEE